MRRNEAKRSTAAAKVSTTLSTCAALLGLAAAASAQSVPAGPLSIVTNENPAEPGAFTLDFGALGVVARSSITSTTYELSVDTVRRTARFVSYLQHVEPLILPGGFSTGDITVEIVDGSSAGTFDPFTRTFHTAETYAIHFTGDLSAFGLTSPVFLPSSSSGDLVVDPTEGGVVSMDWDGVGQLSNPFDPSTPIEFTYRCAVNTVFAATPANMVGLALTPDVLSLELPKEIERSLVAVLDRSLAQIQRGKAPRAVSSLREFIEKVEVLSGGAIAAADAAELVAAASHTIDLIGLDRLAGLPAGFRR